MENFVNHKIPFKELLQKLIQRALAQDPKIGNQHRLAQKSEVKDNFLSRATRAFPDKVKVDNIFGLLKGLGILDFRMVADQILEGKAATKPQEKLHYLTKLGDSILKEADELIPHGSEHILRGMQLDLMKIKHHKELNLLLKMEYQNESKMENVSHLEIFLSLKGECLWVSEDFCQLFRRTKEELLNNNWFEVMNAKQGDIDLARHWFNKILKEKIDLVIWQNIPHISSNPIKWVISPVFEEGGKILGFRGQARIDESKEESIINIKKSNYPS